jgi:hypothetical protein
MEDLFVLTTRFRDVYRAREGANDDEESSIDRQMNRLVELELITGSSAEDTFLHCGFTWSDFYSWARGKIVWISPDVFFDLCFTFYTRFQMETDHRSFLHVGIEANEEDTSQESKFLTVCASSEAHATVASDILLQLLTTCESRKVELSVGGDFRRFAVPGLAFSHFLVQSRNLKVLRIHFLRLNTCHCRGIDALTRTDLQIELFYCLPTESGEEILLESIRQNRGPTKFISCEIDTRRLAGALRGNNSVTALAPRSLCSDEERLLLVQALAENVGLVTFNFKLGLITDEIWVVLWQSVARHPTLKKIALSAGHYRSTWRDGTTDAQKSLRMQAMVDALRVNTVLHTIELNRREFDQEILDSTVYPLLLANRYRPCVGAITEVRGPMRCKLLGRALIWLFLSENADIRFGPTPAEEREVA